MHRFKPWPRSGRKGGGRCSSGTRCSRLERGTQAGRAALSESATRGETVLSILSSGGIDACCISYRSNKSHAEGGRKSRLGHGRRSSEDGYSIGGHHKKGVHHHEHHKRSKDVGAGQRRRSHEEHGHRHHQSHEEHGHGHRHHKKSKPDADVELETFTTIGKILSQQTQ